MSRPATIADIARLAGVSAMTVSNVLNERGRISSDTRARVLDTVQSVGYVANAAARSLRGARSNILGILVQDLSNPYFAEIVRGASESIRRHNLDLVLYTSSNDPERERERVASLSSGISDGLVIISAHGSPGLSEQLEHSRVPVVLVNDWSDSPLSRVNAENFLGAKGATEHLIALGHRRIGFVLGVPDSVSSPARPDGLERLRGYRMALNDAGIPYDAKLVIHGGLHQPQGRAAAQMFFALAKPPTAIFAANDFCAFGVIEAARDHGLQVPQDLSVIGFDDIPVAALAHPALTTVSHPLFAMGARAVDALVDLVRNPSSSGSTLELPSHLIVRHTTAPPAH